MKKKYVAVMSGLVLSMSTASVYAAGSSAEIAAESTKDSSSDDSDSKALDDKAGTQGESRTVSHRKNRMETTVNHR